MTTELPLVNCPRCTAMVVGGGPACPNCRIGWVQKASAKSDDDDRAQDERE